MSNRAPKVRFPLQTRIALLVTLLLLSTILTMSGIYIHRLHYEKRKSVRDASEAIALFVGNLMVARMVGTKKDIGLLERFVDTAVRLYRDVAFITVVDEDGSVEYGRLNPSVVPTADTESERVKIAQFAAGGAVPPKVGAVTLTIVAPPESGKGEQVELGRVRVGFSLRSLESRIVQVTVRSLAVAAGILAVGVLISYLLGRRISRPLRKLAFAMEAVQKGDLDHDISIASKDEVGLLARSFNVMVRGLREREKYRENFARYVSPQLVERIMHDPDSVVLHGERRDVTVLFSDIRGFTRLTDEMAPEELVFMLNEYFDKMVDVVFRYDGYLNKFMGDAVMAVFGAPLPVADHPWRAVACAAEMFNALHVLNKARRKRGDKELKIGIGISTGEVIVGNIGSLKKLEYTAIGDAVNLAQRIEDASKTVDGIPLLISAATYSAIMDRVDIEALQPMLLKGKTVPVQVYQVTGIKEIMK
ncbi:MAG: HAMP domain-containing protein [Deltaproteobacteria bacterium]|nr:HAMP domain-containing protein [Deltaproteobacteria bacterium]